MNLTLIAILIFVILYKFLVNLYRFLRVKYFLKWYFEWLKTKEWDLVQYQPEVTELFKKAHISDASVPVVEPVGYGRIISTTTSAFLNFPSQDGQTANLLVAAFNRAIGVYRRRMWQSLNPFWWIEFFIFMPVNIIGFLGFSSENKTSKALQLVYWTIGILISAILSLYPELIRLKIQGIVEYLKF